MAVAVRSMLTQQEEECAWIGRIILYQHVINTMATELYHTDYSLLALLGSLAESRRLGERSRLQVSTVEVGANLSNDRLGGGFEVGGERNGVGELVGLGDTLGFAGLGGERKSLLSGRDVDSLLVREARPLEFVDGSQVSRLRRKARPVLPPLAAARLAHRLDKARGVANHGPEQIWAHIRGGAGGHHSSVSS